MNKTIAALAGLCLLATCLPAAASEIYKRVNEDGVTEFSDRPMENADRVEVNPNVVVTNQVKRPDRSAAAPAADAPPAAPARRQNLNTESTSYVNSARRSRLARDEARERREQRGTRQQIEDEPVSDPNPGRALRNAARAGGR